MASESATRFDAPFTEWWVWLTTGAVIRTWGSVLLEHDGYVSIGGRAAEDGRFVEMCGVPEGAVVGVRRGSSVNGEPRHAPAPTLSAEDRHWQSALSADEQ